MSDRRVEIETERFRLRSLTPIDASDRWLGWTRDPEVMGPLNVPVGTLTLGGLAAYLATSENEKRYVIGIFDKKSGSQIGFFTIDVDTTHAVAAFNVVIGEKDWWGKGVVNEARAVLLDYFFDQRGIEKACGAPLARNFAAVFNYKEQDWRHEGTLRGQSRSLGDGSRLDQYQFGILCKEWRARRGKGPS
jgi:RimJ/RimL family protein N-acetyltransferase